MKYRIVSPRICDLATACSLAILLTCVADCHGSLVTVAGTGWNADVILEAGSTDPPIFNNHYNNTISSATWLLYEQGYSNSFQGLNSSGAYVGSSGYSYQMQDYETNNVIRDNGTFSLSNPGQFEDIGFLVTHQHNTGLTAFWNATLNFSDNSSTTFSSSGIDWTKTSTQVVVSNHGVVEFQGSKSFYTGPLSMVERTFSLNAADQLKTLESVQFSQTASSTDVLIHAVSGNSIVTTVPEPSAAVSFIFGMLAIGSRRRRSSQSFRRGFDHLASKPIVR